MKNIKIALGALTVFLFAATAIFLFRMEKEREQVVQTSDLARIKQTIKIGMDPWVGYAPLCADQLRVSMRKKGIALECVPDNADYHARMAKLRDGVLDLAVSTVDAALVAGESLNFPAVTIAVLDQSKGGDACVAWTDKISSIDALKLAKDWKIAFTPDSPSHQLLRSIGNDFGVKQMLQKGSWRIETNGAREALQLFLQKKVDVACLWEPFVTKARTQKGAAVIHSSAYADKIIVDVLMASRATLTDSKKRAAVQQLLEEYFAFLRDMREKVGMVKTVVRSYLRKFDRSSYSDAELEAMMRGVQWVSLAENVQGWFGLAGSPPYFGLDDAHRFALTIIRAEKGQDFLPYFRTDEVINSSLIGELYAKEPQQTASVQGDSLQQRFTVLSDEQWERLKTYGTLKSRPVIFKSGETELTQESAAAIAQAMDDLRRYPDFRLELRTAVFGNVPANRQRAQERLKAVQAYLVETFGIDPNRFRIRAVDARAVPRFAGESRRAHLARLRQVQFVLKAQPK